MVKNVKREFIGDAMKFQEIINKVHELPEPEKMALIRNALYSDEHLLNIVFRISLIVDRDNLEASLAWIKSRLCHDDISTLG